MVHCQKEIDESIAGYLQALQQSNEPLLLAFKINFFYFVMCNH